MIRVKHAHTVLSLFFCTVLFGNSVGGKIPSQNPSAFMIFSHLQITALEHISVCLASD